MTVLKVMESLKQMVKKKSYVQFNPAIAYFKGLGKIIFYTKILRIANV